MQFNSTEFETIDSKLFEILNISGKQFCEQNFKLGGKNLNL